MSEFSHLVIGGGIAGLTFALEVAHAGRVAVLFKKSLTQSSTAWAQGGVAAVTTPQDTLESHIQDTLTAGAGLCNPRIVDLVVREGPRRVEELISRGVRFDKSDSEQYHLHQEGGHSQRRIFHAADQTGYEIQQALLARAREHANIEFFDNANAVDIITTRKLPGARREGSEKFENRVLGAYVLMPDQNVRVFTAPTVLVATGGAGKVYLYTSNPDVSSGDGIAMCYRAGCSIGNMEFFQFHPTCLYEPRAKTFLITEAMRGEGARLIRKNGQAFMHTYHPEGELAPRDIVARAIDHEMKLHGEEFVYLDISHRKPDFIKKHFPTIYERCLEYGYDITTQPIPVVPAAHYCCGGVVCDEHGATKISGLYVAGECAHTGLHGANRLASNSLLEGMVFAYRAAQHALKNRLEDHTGAIPPWDPGSAVDSDEQVVITQNWDEIRRCMWNYVGIVRSTKRLERALRRIEVIKQEIHDYYWNFTVTSDLLELRNLCLVAELVICSAAARKESRGLHYTLDYPAMLPESLDTILTPD